MVTDKIIEQGKYSSKWINSLEKNIIKEINEKVFIETFIGMGLVTINYFVMRKLVNTTGGEFLPNYNTEASKYAVLLTWIAFAAILLVSIIQLIMKKRSYKNNSNLSVEKSEYYKNKLLNRSMRVVFLVIFYIILYQVFFQITMTGIDIKSTILWWLVILNVLIFTYMSLINLKDYINIKKLSSALEEVISGIKNGDFKISYNNLKKNRLEYVILNGNKFDITYKAIEELASLAERVEGKELGSLISKTELITNVSHDLKTPLTSIINYVDFLTRGGLGKEEKHQYIDILDRKSKRLKVLIGDLKESTEASSGKISLECSNINLKSILNQALLESKEKIETSFLDFKLSLMLNNEFLTWEDKNSNIREVYADPNKMLRVFQNIISNILKYSLKDSKVYIQLEQGESVTLDNGYYTRIIFKNISSDEINIKAEELIERFRRGDSSRKTEGSGLGLDIAKSLVEVQGGEFKISIDKQIFSVNIIL